jgi:hypothetical protein
MVHRLSVIDVRRGVDLLEQYPKIDADRIAFTGIEYGAWTGSIVAGVEFRILTYLLLDCPTQPSQELNSSDDPKLIKIRNTLTSEQLSQWEVTLKKLDPVNYLPYHRNSNILFQFSQVDSNLNYINHPEIVKSTSEPKTVETYKISGFDLINLSEAVQSRNNWLFNHL